VDALYFSPIDAEKGTWLEREFEEQEVWEVVFFLLIFFFFFFFFFF
jgi:hypothetical protein